MTAYGDDPRGREPFVAPAIEHPDHGIVFAPIRHHSPACAAALRAMIREIAPRQVLIEGPCDFDHVLPVLLDDRLIPPVAIVAFREADDDTAVTSYYPLSRHAPEFVALQEAKRIRAAARFIDLPSQARLGDTSDTAQHDSMRSLTSDVAFTTSDFVAALCRRTGCRDQNDLWDHLFESRLGEPGWRAFFGSVAAYCAAVRATIPASMLASDNTLARETHMAAQIAAATAQPGPIVVVTGGLHTPALAAALSASTPIAPAVEAGGGKVYVVRYGFRELDRLNGYAAGLPSPAYYDALWEHATTGRIDWRQACTDTLLGFAEHLRAHHPALALSIPTLSGTAEAASRLAQLRDRPGPMRTDLIDAVLSTTVKGEAHGEFQPVLKELRHYLTGDRLGDVPPSAGSPPLVEHVRAMASELGFQLSAGSARQRQLDIYRKPRDLGASRFLHAMDLLQTGFARRLNGPDPVTGRGIDLLFETWSAAWSPQVESRLVALSRHGATLAAAALAEMRRLLQASRHAPDQRSARATVGLLSRACLAGLQPHLGEFIDAVTAAIADDPDIATVGEALAQLFLLWKTRTLLGVVDRPEIEQLIGAAYRRALVLADDVQNVHEDNQPTVLKALVTLRQVVVSASRETRAIDPDLFDQVVDRALDKPLPPLLAGAMIALGHRCGRIETEEVARRMKGHLGSATRGAEDCVAALRGFVSVSPELLIRLPELMHGVDDVIQQLPDDQFIAALPHLRLAFSALNPRETDALAAVITGRYDAAGAELQAGQPIGASEVQVIAGLALDRKLIEMLTADGLQPWTLEPWTLEPRTQEKLAP